MDKKDLQKKLNKPYSTENWREVVQFVFPNVQILNPPIVIPIKNDKVEQFRQLGSVQLHDGKMLLLFELKLKENVNIIRNRVELNKIVSEYIDKDLAHGVLSIYEKGGDDYRFTFTAKSTEYDEIEQDFINKETDKKRYTYVLGKNESCKTPAQRFYELSENKNKAEIKDIENAFSVEKLSKAFFKEYKDQYTAFVNYMMQTPGIFKAIYSEDDKAIRDFVKILLGRIIFIKFVQKKGWMGVNAASKKWIDGDYRFLENGFANFNHQNLFYSTFLEPLFDALNEPNRLNDIFTVTNTRVPYLSGGLFELDDKKTKNINFPAKYFNDLFEFLDRYNFTIDENDTNDHEVGIDPEMLGHIFENLLEDNKDKGAFYTPKEIVRYMCQESLKEYLKTSLENHKQWPSDEAEVKDFEQALHNFITKKEAGGIIEYGETIAQSLKNVKICDPAIGSGAFPMGLLNEIFLLVHKLYEESGDNKYKIEKIWELLGWQPNLVKQNIIQNSIYGVDIEKGAVDVARLRFWLSLIVDEPEPKALPHLDYKIMVGNSLVSKLDDTIIDIDWNLDETQHGLFGSELVQQRATILQNISDKQKAVFDPNSDEEKLSLEIRNLKIDLLCKQLELMINNQNIPKEPKISDYQNKTKAKFVQDQAKYFETVGWQQQITKLQKLKKQPKAPLHFFDWKLDFPEIMNNQVTVNVGFDIVVGNPPYVQMQKNSGYLAKQLESGKFETYEKTGDIYCIFYEKGVSLLKQNGILTYITSNKWMRAGYGKSLRNFFATKTNPIQLIDFAGQKIFETATVDTNILIVQKSKNKNSTLSCLVKEKWKGSLIEYVSLNYIVCDFSSLNSWVILSPIEQKIREKIEQNGTPLKDWNINIYRGILTGYNEAFIINSETKDRLIKQDPKSVEIIRPILRGRDIKRYSYEFADLYLIATFPSKKYDIENYPAVKQHLLSFGYDRLKQTGELGARKKTNNKWFETQDSISYWEDFYRQKIIYPNMTKFLPFIYDQESFLTNQKCFIITGENISYLTAFLNSSIFKYCFKDNFPELLGGTRELSKIFFDKIPIKKIDNETNGIFEKLVNQIQLLRKEKKSTLDLELKIDNLLFDIYNLNKREKEEIGFIDIN